MIDTNIRNRRMRRLMLFAFALLWQVSDSRPATGRQPEETPAAKTDEENAVDPEMPDAEGEDEERLPKLEDMPLPTVEQLLQEPPVDWIVMPGDVVLVVHPISPRPNTLEQMEALVQKSYDEEAKLDPVKLGPDKVRELVERLREKRDRLRHLRITLSGNYEEPEYEVHMKDIRGIIYHEELMLRRVDKLLDGGHLETAFEVLFVLTRQRPKWPGLAPRRNRHLLLEAQSLREEHRPERSLTQLELLHSRDPKFRGLEDELGRTSDQLISLAVDEDDFRRARHFLNRLVVLEPKHSVVGQWRTRLLKQSQDSVRDAVRASETARHDVALNDVERAARIWPSNPGLRTTYPRLASRFQRLRVGVVRPELERASFPFDTQSQLRERELLNTALFDVRSVQDVARYSSRYFESWEPTDLGRKMTFRLRPSRTTSDAQSPVTARTVVNRLAARLSPDNPEFDARLAGYVSGIQVDSPFGLTVEFSGVPVKPEALLAFPLERASPASGAPPGPWQRFRVHSREGDRVWFRRSVVEPESVRVRHTAEIVEQTYDSHELAVQALLRGEVLMLPDVPPWDVERLRNVGRLVLYQRAVPAVHVLQCNPRSQALRNRELRRALAFAVDREQILQTTVLRTSSKKYARLTNGPFFQGGYALSATEDERSFDLALAIALRLSARKTLDADIPRLKLLCTPEPLARAAARQLVEQWARIGITVELLETGDDAAEWDVLYRTDTMREPVVDLWRYLALSEDSSPQAMAQLPDWLRNEIVDLDEAANWRDAVRLLRELHVHLTRDVRLIPLWEVDRFIVARDNIQQIPTRPVSVYQNIERWVVKAWYTREQP